MKQTVLLINRALPYNCVGKLTGRSGVEYGTSAYDEAHGAHVCRLPLEEWRACKEDVTYGFTRRWSQWEVDFEAEVAPATIRTSKYSPADLAAVTNFKQLLKIAKEVGVPGVERFNSTAELREEILAKQADDWGQRIADGTIAA